MVRPILLYDGDCGFCRTSVARLRARTDGAALRPRRGARVSRALLYVPLRVPKLLARLGVRIHIHSVRLLESRGRISSGATAILRALSYAPGFRALALLVRFAPLRAVAEASYRLVARHRPLAARIDRALFARVTGPTRHRVVRWLFLRGLGAVYLVAFTSLRSQLLGLYGERGILPIRQYLDAVRSLKPKHPYWTVPTVFWRDASDATLLRVARLGQLASVALVVNFAPRLAAAVAWATYLSYVTVGRDFLSFQWDALLLETGANAIVAAPSGVVPGLGSDEVPSEVALALRWLAFRLHFGSGIAKLRSGDTAWRRLTACGYHAWTQPLPTRVSHRMNQLPVAMKRALTLGVLVGEIAAPLLAFGPRRARRIGFALVALLQAGIQLTGNFGFFNVLSLDLLVWFLDDADLGAWSKATKRDPPRPRSVGARVLGAMALLPMAIVSVATLSARLFAPIHGRFAPRIAAITDRFHLVSAYGLFSAMTLDRPEIVIEASMDGVGWRPYELRHKPGDPMLAPRWSQPHMPRLDWQMWFAAMRGPPSWFVALLVRLLEAEPDVLALFARVPFGRTPPRYVRATLYAYRMTDGATRARTGAWWKRQELGPYFPPIALAPDRASSGKSARSAKPHSRHT